MSPAVAPIPPEALKEILCLHGYRIIAEDDYNWSLTDKTQEKSEPIIVPKIGELVALDVMMQTLIDAKLNLSTYFILKEKVLGKNWGYPAKPQPSIQDRPN
jgi:hypothetical protein